MTEAVRNIIELARSQLGVTEDPKGSNNVPYNTAYYGKPINNSAYAWCAVFIWWLFRQTGLSSLYYNGEKTASCSVIYTWARNNKLTVSFDNAEPGDIALFDWNADSKPDHVGLVIGRTNSGDLQTIEGNVSDSVKLCTRTPSQTCLVYRPKYPADPEKPAYVTRDELQQQLASYLTKGQLREMIQQALTKI